jgi:hypothetical protein
VLRRPSVPYKVGLAFETATGLFDHESFDRGWERGAYGLNAGTVRFGAFSMVVMVAEKHGCEFGLKPHRFAAEDGFASGPGSGLSLRGGEKFRGRGKVHVINLRESSLEGNLVGTSIYGEERLKECLFSVSFFNIAVFFFKIERKIQKTTIESPAAALSSGPLSHLHDTYSWVTAANKSHRNSQRSPKWLEYPWMSHLLFVRITNLGGTRVWRARNIMGAVQPRAFPASHLLQESMLATQRTVNTG